MTIPAASEGLNVEAVGYCDLDERPAFKMTIRESGGRWFLYTGHFWHSGWSVVDVTRPTKPEVVNFLPGPPDTWTLQVDLAGDTMITALEKIFPNFGGRPDAPYDEGVLIWNLADPVKPRCQGQFKTRGTGTHRNGYQGGRYAHLAAGMAGYSGNIYVIVDLSDPTSPKEAGRWWVEGQHKAAGESFPPKRPAFFAEAVEAGSTRATAGCLCGGGFCGSPGEDVSLHGPPYIVGELAYLPYGGAGLIVLDVSDVSRPKPVGRLGFSPPFHAQFGVHSVLPIPDRNIAFVNSEDTSYGKGPAHYAGIVDIADPAAPFLLSVFPEPIPSPGAAYADFSSRGGWCGPHNINHLQHNPDVQKQGDLFYIAHFNAGLRIYDVKNPRLPREVGHFLPPEPRKRYGPMPEGKLVTQSEDVLVDRRGYIYLSDKNQGLWILRYTGPT
jgi:hypothetical protein